MINVNEQVKQAYRNFGSTKNINIVMRDKNNYITTYLSMNDIVGNTFSFEQILEPTNSLTFTGCNASVLKFRAKNTDISQFEDGYIMVFLGVEVDEESYEYINIFHGIIDSIKNTTPMQASMDVVAYDLMYYINKLDVTSWYDTLPFTSGYEQCLPLTAIKGSLFTEINNRVRTKYNVNIQFADYSMPSDSIYFPKNIDDEHVYAGDVLRWICQLNGRYAQMRGITCYFLQLKKNSYYPSATLYPSSGLYPGGMSVQENILSTSYKMGSLNIEKYTTTPIDGIQIIDKNNQQIAYAGENAPLNIFTVNGNPFVYNLEQSKLDAIAENLYEAIQGISYIPLKFDMIGLPYLECGDYINIQVGNTMKSTYIFHRILSGEQALTDRIETKGDEYLPIFKPNTEDKIREAIYKAREEARHLISEYDVAVNIMNDLAVNAMGGYQNYEEAETGGRIYYLSNRPIIKNAQGQCVFEIGATVFKSGGDGLYVSLDGGTTWTNGYNATTGRLVVNVLNAIGISADWIIAGSLVADRIRGGSLMIGGVNDELGKIVVCPTEGTAIGSSFFPGSELDIYIVNENSSKVFKSKGTATHTADQYINDLFTQPINIFTSATFTMYSGTTHDPQLSSRDVYEIDVSGFTYPTYIVMMKGTNSLYKDGVVIISEHTFSGSYTRKSYNIGASTPWTTRTITISPDGNATYGGRTIYFDFIYNASDFFDYVDDYDMDYTEYNLTGTITNKDFCQQLGYIVFDGNIVEPAHTETYRVNGLCALSIDVSNIVSVSNYDGICQIYKTVDGGETYAILDELELKEGLNFLNVVFDLPTLYANTQFYKIVLGAPRSSTSVYNFALTSYSFITNIDRNGITTSRINATGGNFGIMEIDSSEDEPYIKIPTDIIICEIDTEYSKNFTKYYNFIPYAEGWEDDGTISYDFSSDNSDLPYICRLQLQRRAADEAWSTLETIYLTEVGSAVKRVKQEGVWVWVEDPDHDGKFNTVINHMWGKNSGERYRISVYIRYDSTYWSPQKMAATLNVYVDDTYTVSKITQTEIVGTLRGKFNGIANLTDLTIGDWLYDEYHNSFRFSDDSTITDISPTGLEIQDSNNVTSYSKDSAYFNDGINTTTLSLDELKFDDNVSNYSELTLNHLELNERNNNVDSASELTPNSLAFVGNSTVDNSEFTLSHLEFSSRDNLHGTTNYADLTLNNLTFDNNTDGYHMSINALICDITRNMNFGSESVSWISGSDKRIKEDIENLDVKLSKELIDKTQPKKFKFKYRDGKHYGMIAQETREVLDSLGETDSELEYLQGNLNVEGQRAIRYEEYIPHLINYVKELKAEIDSLKSEIRLLKGE